MATINVRQLDDDLVQTLKRRAVKNNRSLEGEVRHILQRVVTDDLTEKCATFLALAARLRLETEGTAQTPAEILVREDREHGHRIL